MSAAPAAGGLVSGDAARLLAADLRGKSVLDLGCGAGERCFEALRRGASRVVGVDLDPDAIAAARRRAATLGAAVEFEHRDLDAEPPEGGFDHVLCVGLLEWARDPLRLLARLVELTRERLVVEVADPAVRRPGEARFSPRRYFVSRAPVVEIHRSATSGRFQETPRFGLGYATLENLLFHQRAVFARFAREAAPPGRLVVAAERRRIDELVLVAGPTGSGKSTLIEALQRGREKALAERLALGEGADWPMMSAWDLVGQRDPHVPRALFHYDTLRPFERSAHVHAKERALEVIDTARRTRVVTLWTPQPVLLERFEREGKLDRKSRGKRRLRAIHRLFSDRERVVAHYREWFAYCAERGLEVVVASALEGMRCRSVDEWEREVARGGA